MRKFYLGWGIALSGIGAAFAAEVEENSPESSPQQVRSFTPHITLIARTLDWGKVSLQRSTGANINTTFLLNSLMVTAVPRLEVGTAPLPYLFMQHRWNANAKLNFYRHENLDLSLAFASSQYRYVDIVYGPVGFSILSAQFGMNIRPAQFPLWIGAMVARNTTYIEDDSRIVLGSYESTDEWGLDLSYPLFEVFDVTLGLGRLRNEGYSAYESTHFGWGATVAWYRPGRFFSKPALGFHYAAAAKKTQILFTTHFY